MIYLLEWLDKHPNGDGLDDLIVGAYTADTGGSIYAIKKYNSHVERQLMPVQCMQMTFKFLFLNFHAFKYFYYFIIFCCNLCNSI
jgi:hypothetical protein